jgi:hypothetical protein
MPDPGTLQKAESIVHWDFEGLKVEAVAAPAELLGKNCGLSIATTMKSTAPPGGRSLRERLVLHRHCYLPNTQTKDLA